MDDFHDEKAALHNGATAADKPDNRDKEKERAILKACRWKNLSELRCLAESPGGFLTDSLRQQACKSVLSGSYISCRIKTNTSYRASFIRTLI